MVMKRPALRYHGGKWKIAPWIIESFPPHYTYVEPFGGGASVLLRKSPSPIEVYNDIDSRVVTFFRVLRERENDLVRAVKLTLWAREELELAACPVAESDIFIKDKELEIARRFFVWCWQSFGHVSGGWRYQKSENGYFLTGQWDDAEYLHTVAGRFKNVTIEHDDALAIIRRFDTPKTLFYVDPPYVHSTRSKAAGYAYEMDDNAHRVLAAALSELQGMVVLSGYDSELYHTIYAGWERRAKQTMTNGLSGRDEVLYLSPNATAAMPQMTMRLWGEGEI